METSKIVSKPSEILKCLNLNCNTLSKKGGGKDETTYVLEKNKKEKNPAPFPPIEIFSSLRFTLFDITKKDSLK